jgi:hypothetical protein
VGDDEIIKMKSNFDPLAVWGALLSTLLAVVRIWELWRSRRRIEVSYNFRDTQNGNEVIIRNLNATPVVVCYWELAWLKLQWCGLKKKEIKCIIPDSDFSDIPIPPFGSTKLIFADENYFAWNARALGDTAIFLRIKLAGEKRAWLMRVYG